MEINCKLKYFDSVFTKLKKYGVFKLGYFLKYGVFEWRKVGGVYILARTPFTNHHIRHQFDIYGCDMRMSFVWMRRLYIYIYVTMLVISIWNQMPISHCLMPMK